MKKQIKWATVFLIPIFIFSCMGNSKNKGIATEIANASGVKDFSKIKSIEFTFNVDKDSSHSERHWKWMPTENKVISYDKKDSTVFKYMDTSTTELKTL